jgi:hypothetical protein
MVAGIRVTDRSKVFCFFFSKKKFLLSMLLAVLASCAAPHKAAVQRVPPPPISTKWQPSPDQHVPPFATVPFEPFSRADAIAIAQREWRLFGQPIDDDPPDSHPKEPEEQMPERMPGLWQRVGEYWWEGMNPDIRESAWTGMHDENGTLFDAPRDGDFAWSAAFISYVMRIAGAGNRFPYSESHSTYIDAAVLGQSPVLRAYAANAYAPRVGDLICTGRDGSAAMRFTDLPAAQFPSHCDIVVAEAPTELTVIGGNVDDAVTEKHVPLATNGMLAGLDGKPIDTRYDWFVVLMVLYDR